MKERLINQPNQDFYEKYGAEYSSPVHRQAQYVASAYKVSNLCILMEGLKPETIVDFGCGLGDALDMLAKHFQVTNAIGIDISSTTIAYARKEYPEYTFIQGSLEKLKNLQADLIILFDVVEHLEDIPSYLEAAKRSGKYIGIKIPLEKSLLISVLNCFHLRQRKIRFYESDRHLYEFNQSEVETLLRNAGLKIVKKKIRFLPKEIHFSAYAKNHMKAKSGRLAKLKYCVYVALSKLPYPITRPLFQFMSGADFFALCKS